MSETGLKDGGMGGSLPATPTRIPPITELPIDSPNTGPTPFDSIETDELKVMEKELGIKPPARPSGDSEIDDLPPETSVDDEGYASEAEWIKDLNLGFEQQYDNVRDLVMDLHKKSLEFEKRYGAEHPIMDKLEKTARTLGVTPESLMDGLASSLDPRGQAMPQGHQFQNFEKFIADHSGDIDFQGENGRWGNYYRSMAGAIAADITSQIESRYGRLLNGYDTRIDELGLDYRLDQHLADPKRADWKKRRHEIRNTLLDPKHKEFLGKPNDIDWAMRFLGAGDKTETVEQRANRISKDKIQEIEARKRKYHTEGPGRSPMLGKTPTDVRQWTREQLEAQLKELDRRGVSPV